MPMDPYSVLINGLAIAHTVGYGLRAVRAITSCRGLFTGFKAYNEEITAWTTEMEGALDRLKATKPRHPSGAVPPEVALSSEITRAQTLMERMNAISKGLGREPRSLAIFKHAAYKFFGIPTKRDEIGALQRQLVDVHNQANSNLLSTLRDDQTSMFSFLKAREDGAAYVQNTQTLQRLTEDLLAALATHKTNDNETVASAAARSMATMDDVRTQVQLIGSRIEAVLSERKTLAVAQRILEQLAFPDMQARRSTIKEECPGTFKWIFEADKTPFKTWLESGSGVFWVNGKLGSGKSTLMRFLSNHDKAESILKDWAADADKCLVTASYFFWCSGSAIQCSQEGLLRALLYQILCQCPELSTRLFKKRLNQPPLAQFHPEPWTRSELSEALKEIVTQDVEHLSARFCFFIDGLDEFDGDHFDLIRDLDTLTSTGCSKICVSSRPRTVFVDHYARSKDQQIVLQELTEADMSIFIEALLQKDDRFDKRAMADADVAELVTMIKERAQGVFLWVFLVVRSLLRGMSNQDDIDTLQERLSELPTELVALFRQILDKSEHVYQASMAKLLTIALWYRQHGLSLYLESIGHLAEQCKDPDFALNAPMDDSEHLALAATARRNLSLWGGDFLEVSRSNESSPLLADTIEFSHRSIADYLKTHEVQQLLTSRLPAAFDPAETSMSLSLRLTKSLPTSINSPRSFVALMNACMAAAKVCEQKFPRSSLIHIQELERVAHMHWELSIFESLETDRWASSDPLQKMASEAHLYPVAYHILACAVHHGLSESVKRYLFNGQIPPKHPMKTALLDHVVGRRYGRGLDEAFVQIIEMLLVAGANPNWLLPSSDRRNYRSADYMTIWQAFLFNCLKQKFSGRAASERYLPPIASVMLHHGADPQAIILKSGTVLECLRSYCSTAQLEELKSLIGTAPVEETSGTGNREVAHR